MVLPRTDSFKSQLLPLEIMNVIETEETPQQQSMEAQASSFDLQHHCTNKVKINADNAFQYVFFKKYCQMLNFNFRNLTVQ